MQQQQQQRMEKTQDLFDHVAHHHARWVHPLDRHKAQLKRTAKSAGRKGTKKPSSIGKTKRWEQRTKFDEIRQLSELPDADFVPVREVQVPDMDVGREQTTVTVSIYAAEGALIPFQDHRVVFHRGRLDTIYGSSSMAFPVSEVVTRVEWTPCGSFHFDNALGRISIALYSTNFDGCHTCVAGGDLNIEGVQTPYTGWCELGIGIRLLLHVSMSDKEEWKG